MPGFRRYAAIAAAASTIAGTAAAAKAPPKPAPEPVDDLSVPVVRHIARCPPPSVGVCILRKPVDSGYRVLSEGAALEDKGDHWIADFSKNKAATALLRVLGRNGDLHEIEVSFRASAKIERPAK